MGSDHEDGEDMGSDHEDGEDIGSKADRVRKPINKTRDKDGKSQENDSERKSGKKRSQIKTTVAGKFN